MGDELRERLENSIGQTAVIYTQNGKFRFNCRIINVFANFVEIFDTKKNFKKVIKIDEITEVDFL